MGGRTRRGVLGHRLGGRAGAAGGVWAVRVWWRGPGGSGDGPSRTGTTVAYLGNHNQAESQVVEPQMKGFEQKFPGAKVEVTNLTAGYDEKLQ